MAKIEESSIRTFRNFFPNSAAKASVLDGMSTKIGAGIASWAQDRMERNAFMKMAEWRYRRGTEKSRELSMRRERKDAAIAI